MSLNSDVVLLDQVAKTLQKLLVAVWHEPWGDHRENQAKKLYDQNEDWNGKQKYIVLHFKVQTHN
jgi:hypothetical protein